MYTRLTTPLGGIGVAIFLFLSGYGLSASYLYYGINTRNFWLKRIVGVWIPYVLFELLTIPLRSNVDFKSFILDIFLIKPQFHLGWYIPYLFVWYFLFWLIHTSTQRISLVTRRNRFHICMLIAAAMSLSITFLDSGIRFEQSITFLMGTICAYKPNVIRKIKNYLIAYSLLCLSFIFLVLKQFSQIRQILVQMPAWWDLIMKTSAALSIIIITLLLMPRIPKLMRKIITNTGTISFELYLVHGCALAIFNLNIALPLKAILFFVVSFVGAFVFNKFNKGISMAMLRK